MNANIATIQRTSTALTHAEHQSAIRAALKSSLYPGASDANIDMVLDYCAAAGLDPMQKPVHIVPMWDSKAKTMRDVVMPGIGLYRVQAARSGQFAGMSEPEFGPMVTETLGIRNVTFPEWCKVTAYRQLSSGHIAAFTAVEYWIENYAIKGGKEQDQSPNAMWSKRVRGQIAKCAQAQALRMAFPEIGAQPTAEEMEGKPIIEGEAAVVHALDDRALSWIAEAETIQSIGEYAPLREKVMADYGGKAEAIPREVRTALSHAKERANAQPTASESDSEQ